MEFSAFFVYHNKVQETWVSYFSTDPASGKIFCMYLCMCVFVRYVP